MAIDKSVRWENIDLRIAGLSKPELQEVVSVLRSRLVVVEAVAQPRIRQAIKRANVLINTPKPRKQKMKVGNLPSDNEPVGRYGGGMGAATFFSGGAPGSRR